MDLGITAQDKITGFIGVVVGIVYYISGCNQALVVPKVKADGSSEEGRWFDLQRLERSGAEKIVLDNGATPGADAAPPRRF